MIMPGPCTELCHQAWAATQARAAVRSFSIQAESTLFTSTEPCVMCTGAIYWAGILRVVFALSEGDLGAMVPEQSGVPTLSLPSREVFARGGRAVEVVGPVSIEAATEVHLGFWAGESPQ